MRSAVHVRAALVAAFLVAAASVFFPPFTIPPARGESAAERYYRVGDWPKAAAAYEEVVRQGAGPEDLVKAAEADYRAGRLERAALLANRVLEKDDSVEARIILALIKARRGSPREALRDVESLKRTPADDHKVYTAIGVIVRAEDAPRALEYFRKAVDLNPDDFWAWFNMGLVYEDREVFEQATRAYKNAVRINPLYAQAQNNLGYSYKERRFYAYAVEHYRKAIELLPDNPGFYYNIGNAYSHQEKIDEAFNAYRKALELDPAFAKAHYNMARMYLRKDMVSEAIEEFRLYLRYGSSEVFGYVAPRAAVETEIKELETYLEIYGEVKPAGGSMAR